MIKITFKLLISLISILLILLVYLSIIGVTTDKFNSKIATQIQQIDPNLNLKLNSVIVKLDPFNFGINAKTIGTDLVYRNKVINIETIESKISIKSFLNDKFSLTEIFISTKPLVIKDLVTFLRLLNNDPKFFIAEKVINKGYVIADLKLEFDESGKIKKTYQINGLVKDGKINLLSVLDPAYVEAISSVSGGLEALESGDPNGLASLLDRPDALNTIFKPKADKFLGKRFIAENGFEGIVRDINLDIGKAVITEDGQNAVMSANFEVFSQKKYDDAIKGGATPEAATIQATQTFSTFMPDSAGEFLRQNTTKSSDATQVSVTDMIDFAASTTNLLQSAIKYDGSFFKFAKNLKDSQTYSKTILETDDKIKINQKVEEILLKNIETVFGCARVITGNLILINKLKILSLQISLML